MKTNILVRIIVTIGAMLAILEIGIAASAYFIVENAFAAGETIPQGVANTSFYGGLITGSVYGIATILLSLWVIGARFAAKEVVHCKDCVHWSRTNDVCHNPDGMCASGEDARNNGCNLWERRE